MEKSKRNEEQDEDKDEEKQNEVKAPSYSSRLLNCTRCEEVIETKWMQLHTFDGFRGIYCGTCKKQERCLFNTCQCGEVWHQCLVHRVDPPLHASTRGQVTKNKVIATIKKKKAHGVQHRARKRRRSKKGEQRKEKGTGQKHATK